MEKGKEIYPPRPLTVTVVQNAAGEEVAGNLDRIEKLLSTSGPEDLVVLTEVFAYRGDDAGYRSRAEPLNGPLMRRLGEWACQRHAWILAGSVLEQAGEAVYNTSVLLDRSGTVVASYRKMHLFEAHLESGQVIREADAYSYGEKPCTVQIEGWTCGLAICYDLRFPELFRRYADAGAHLLLTPSNFTHRTGRDHWEILVRARAIENQCFHVAPNQCGDNPRTKVTSYGHSLVVGPWGDVLTTAGESEMAVTITLDPLALAVVRRRVPALQHRRL